MHNGYDALQNLKPPSLAVFVPSLEAVVSRHGSVEKQNSPERKTIQAGTWKASRPVAFDQGRLSVERFLSLGFLKSFGPLSLSAGGPLREG